MIAEPLDLNIFLRLIPKTGIIKLMQVWDFNRSIAATLNLFTKNSDFGREKECQNLAVLLLTPEI